MNSVLHPSARDSRQASIRKYRGAVDGCKECKKSVRLRPMAAWPRREDEQRKRRQAIVLKCASSRPRGVKFGRDGGRLAATLPCALLAMCMRREIQPVI